jgi:insecticidal toxin complex protein TccC
MNANMHRRTPSVLATDPRGLPIRQIEYLRDVAGSETQSLITRQQHDVAGRLTAQRDPRLLAPNQTSVYALNGAVLKSESVDAGWRLSLPGPGGETRERHGERGNVWRTQYDKLMRVVSLEENNQANVETFDYADGSANPSMNLRGQLLNQVDPSGRIDCESYAMTGALLRDTFTSHDNQSFTSSRTYSPLGAVLAHLDAGGHQQQFRYDVAGQIQQVQLQLNAQTTWQTVQLNAQYNAAGQVIEQQAGNGVTSRWRYAAANGRLHRHSARIGQQSPLQDFEYTYDRVGNITQILDHTFTPTFFANQRVDGARKFIYDSLYRLLSASGYDDAVPMDNTGPPQPTDPNDRRNYVQTYKYDKSNNLVELRHVRDGANHTRRMRIDPNSNRGVRCNDNDPEPDFDTLFDRHGNQQMLQAGQPLQWNTRDQLEKITLVARDNLPDDEEFYEYSQGARVYKRHTLDSGKHFHAVRYLPGLEIRSKDNGEELHVITLATGVGSVRCLYWLTPPPSGVEQTQMRYTLEDHLGSSTMELDHLGRMISHEGYYPFGATAWMAALSLIEVAYKFIRYSGKEMDVSGLYYYGERYYAPWLQRWVSADPAGDVDGLNLYGFVGNNPLRYVDTAGLQRAESVIHEYSKFIKVLDTHTDRTLRQVHNVIHQENIAVEMFKNLVSETLSAVTSTAGGVIGGSAFAQVAPVPFLDGLIGGNLGADLVGRPSGRLTSEFAGPLIPQTSSMSISEIDRQAGLLPTRDVIAFHLKQLRDPAGFSDFLVNRVVGSFIPGLGMLALGSRAQEAEDINNRLDPVKIGKIDTMLIDWKSAIQVRWAQTEEAFKTLDNELGTAGDPQAQVRINRLAPIVAPEYRATLGKMTHKNLDYIDRMQQGMSWYKAMGTTDNQWILKNPRAAASRRLKLSTAS